MLPFLQKKNQTGLLVTQRSPDGSNSPVENQEPESDDIEACAQELIAAVHAKDAPAAARAIRDAFSILQSEPESEEPSPHTYQPE